MLRQEQRWPQQRWWVGAGCDQEEWETGAEAIWDVYASVCSCGLTFLLLAAQLQTGGAARIYSWPPQTSRSIDVCLTHTAEGGGTLLARAQSRLVLEENIFIFKDKSDSLVRVFGFVVSHGAVCLSDIWTSVRMCRQQMTLAFLWSKVVCMNEWPANTVKMEELRRHDHTMLLMQSGWGLIHASAGWTRGQGEGGGGG